MSFSINGRYRLFSNNVSITFLHLFIVYTYWNMLIIVLKYGWSPLCLSTSVSLLNLFNLLVKSKPVLNPTSKNKITNIIKTLGSFIGRRNNTSSIHLDSYKLKKEKLKKFVSFVIGKRKKKIKEFLYEKNIRLPSNTTIEFNLDILDIVFPIAILNIILFILPLFLLKLCLNTDNCYKESYLCVIPVTFFLGRNTVKQFIKINRNSYDDILINEKKKFLDSVKSISYNSIPFSFIYQVINRIQSYFLVKMFNPIMIASDKSKNEIPIQSVMYVSQKIGAVVPEHIPSNFRYINIARKNFAFSKKKLSQKKMNQVNDCTIFSAFKALFISCKREVTLFSMKMMISKNGTYLVLSFVILCILGYKTTFCIYILSLIYGILFMVKYHNEKDPIYRKLIIFNHQLIKFNILIIEIILPLILFSILFYQSIVFYILIPKFLLWNLRYKIYQVSFESILVLIVCGFVTCIYNRIMDSNNLNIEMNMSKNSESISLLLCATLFYAIYYNTLFTYNSFKETKKLIQCFIFFCVDILCIYMLYLTLNHHYLFSNNYDIGCNQYGENNKYMNDPNQFSSDKIYKYDTTSDSSSADEIITVGSQDFKPNPIEGTMSNRNVNFPQHDIHFSSNFVKNKQNSSDSELSDNMTTLDMQSKHISDKKNILNDIGLNRVHYNRVLQEKKENINANGKNESVMNSISNIHQSLLKSSSNNHQSKNNTDFGVFPYDIITEELKSLSKNSCDMDVDSTNNYFSSKKKDILNYLPQGKKDNQRLFKKNPNQFNQKKEIDHIE